MTHGFLLCPYDGFKFRIYDKLYINFLRDNATKFNLFQRIRVDAGLDNNNINEHYEGEYEGFGIKTVWTRYRMAVEISGSFHKHFYNGENVKPFYWENFLYEFRNFVAMFCLEGITVIPVNLEVGINVHTSKFGTVSARSVCESILFFNPPSTRREKDIKEYKKKGYSWCSMHENYWMKIYDKLPRFSKKIDDILRLEKKHKKSAPLKKLGITRIEDLLNEDNVKKLIDDLFAYLRRLIIYQHDLEYSTTITERDKNFLLEYKKSEAWDQTYEKDKKLFRQVKRRYQKLLKTYSLIYLKDDLLKNASSLLNERCKISY